MLREREPLKALRILNSGEVRVKSPEPEVSAHAGGPKSQGVREGYALMLSERPHGLLDNILVLKTQMSVMAQHFDGRDDVFAGLIVKEFEDPGYLGHHLEIPTRLWRQMPQRRRPNSCRLA